MGVPEINTIILLDREVPRIFCLPLGTTPPPLSVYAFNVVIKSITVWLHQLFDKEKASL